ncbi:MAG: YbaK/EbsC family protein [Rhodospirillales bacterium]|nr:YbaK/EbsC family protein [Rhodospirillales bacterium]
MALATTLQQYLAERKVAYDVTTHDPTTTASRSAQQSHVPGDWLAKAVVVKDDERFVMAVLPASHHLRLGELSRLLDRQVGLATEEEASGLFGDCDFGAIPALGAAYGLEMVVDDSLASQPEIYFEGGDHRSLVHVSAEGFHTLTEGARHGSFSSHD